MRLFNQTVGKNERRGNKRPVDQDGVQQGLELQGFLLITEGFRREAKIWTNNLQ